MTLPFSIRRSIAGCRLKLDDEIPVLVTRFSKSMNKAMRRSVGSCMPSSSHDCRFPSREIAARASEPGGDGVDQAPDVLQALVHGEGDAQPAALLRHRGEDSGVGVIAVGH